LTLHLAFTAMHQVRRAQVAALALAGGILAGCAHQAQPDDRKLADEFRDRLKVVASQDGPDIQAHEALLRRRQQYRDRTVVSPDGQTVTRLLPVKSGKGVLLAQLVADNLQVVALPGKETVKVTAYPNYDWFYRSNPDESSDATVFDKDSAIDLLQVAGPPAIVDYVEKLITEADYRPQVVIDVAVLELGRGSDFDVGVEWNLKNASQAFFKSLSSNFRFSPIGGEFAGTPTATFGAVHDRVTIDYIIEALAAHSTVEVLSRPTLAVLSGFRAQVDVGEKIPLVKYQPQSGGAVVVETQFEHVGVHLDVLPTVTRDTIRLEIRPAVSEVTGFSTSGGVLSPVISHSSTRTSVEIESDQTLVLAGLYARKHSELQRGLPGLKDVPGLRHLTGRTDRHSEWTHIVFLIKPRVLHQSAAEARQALGIK
jgi:type II secretory pathway component GspD/PulD (secretin)